MSGKPTVICTELLPDFDGTTYERDLDHARLTTQLERVCTLLTTPPGQRWKLRELADAVGAPEASISARIRDLRKDKFGGFEVLRNRTAGGLWEYWVERFLL